jgi:hypothetical protein
VFVSCLSSPLIFSPPPPLVFLIMFITFYCSYPTPIVLLIMFVPYKSSIFLFCSSSKYDQCYTHIECIMFEDCCKMSYMINLSNLVPCIFSSSSTSQIVNLKCQHLNQYHQLFSSNLALKGVGLVWVNFATFIFSCCKLIESPQSCIPKFKTQLFYPFFPLAHLLG